MVAPNKESGTLALIMAGGSGTRFWPLSRKSKPKQYINFVDDRSLIQHTVDRLLISPSDIYVCAHQLHEPILKRQLPNVSGLILETASRNTTACLMYSVAVLLQKGISASTVMVALPADHFIKFPEKFQEVLNQAIDFARHHSSLVTLGIVPNRPFTGYGYIEAGASVMAGICSVKRFVEKPDLATAERFMASKNFYWNSGMFVWTLQSIQSAFEKHQPEMWVTVKRAVSDATLRNIYSNLPSLPIDVAILERARNVFVIPADAMGWTDLGSWNALYELKRSVEGANVGLSDRVKCVESRGCLIKASPDKKVALVGVENLIVVEDGDTLLIADRDSDQLVREVSSTFDK